MGKTQARSFEPQTLKVWLLRPTALGLLGLSLSSAALLHLTAASALSQTGTATTNSTPTEALIRPTLKPGNRGAEVTELQATLKLLGYYGGTVDGVYGQSTVAAVSQFQQAAGLSADGITGPATWNRLFPAAEALSTATMPASTAQAPANSAAVNSTTSPSGANTAASFPVPAGASNTPSTAKPAPPRSAVKPTPSTVTPKPAKAAPAPASATATTSTNAPVILPVLRQGMRGSAVIALQERLRSLGVFKGSADGVFGAETLTAVKAAQRSFKLEPDGVVGAGTWSALLR